MTAIKRTLPTWAAALLLIAAWGAVVAAALVDPIATALASLGWAGLHYARSDRMEYEAATERRIGWGYGYGAGYVDANNGRPYHLNAPADGRVRPFGSGSKAAQS